MPIYLITEHAAVQFNSNAENKYECVGAVTIEDIIKRFKSVPDEAKQSPILPSNCVKYGEKYEHDFFLIEEPPRLRKIIYKNKIENDIGSLEEHTLSFPWVYYMVEVKRGCNKEITAGEMYMVISPTKCLTGLEPVFHVPLNNVRSSDGHICFGNNPLSSIPTDTPGVFAQKMIDHFWSLPFNNHYTTDIAGYWPDEFKNYKEWTKLSVENPGFITKVPFTKRGSLNDFFKHSCH